MSPRIYAGTLHLNTMQKLILLLITVILFSCQTKSPKNKFSDPTLRLIYTWQDQRASKALLPYLKNDTALYRAEAAMAFASVQDTNAIPELAVLLNDKEESVKYAAAFALGQTKHPAALSHLTAAYDKETSPKVKAELLIALGKCGDHQTLSFISGLNLPDKDTSLLCGQAWGIFYMANKKLTSDSCVKKSIELTASGMPDTVRYVASCFLARARGIDLTPYTSSLCKVATDDKNIYTRINTARALGKCKSSEAMKTLITLVSGNNDSRIKINGINALKSFAYDSVKTTVLNEVKNTDPNVSYTAAEFFVSNGDTNDAQLYYSTAKIVGQWRTKASLCGAAIKYSNDTFAKNISDDIIILYNTSANVYEKGALLQALANNIMNHSFIAEQTFASDQFPIHTNGMDALINMRRHPVFETCMIKRDEGSDVLEPLKLKITSSASACKADDILSIFTSYLRRAVESGDVAMMGISASMLIDTTLSLPKSNLSKKEILFKLINNDISFIKNAQPKLQLPRDIETYNELQKVVDFFEGKNTKENNQKKPENSINWTEVEKISSTQKAIIKTDKGDIVLQLLIENAPGSTLNFVTLVKEKFFDNKVFHRVIPNFVIQGGCPRGDGWGNVDYTIRSEFTPLTYDEGFVGMASAGKDTEGCQWFITHSPTPHLNGLYSIFAKVLSGMDVVNKIEIGDKILTVELSNP